METGGWWAGWTFGPSISPLLFLGVFIGRCAMKEALLSKFGPAGVKSGLPHSSHMMLSELCRPHPAGFCGHAAGARHLNACQDLGLPLLGSTDCAGAGELPTASSSSSCAQLCAELPTTVQRGCSWLGGTPRALKAALFLCVLGLSVFPVIH